MNNVDRLADELRLSVEGESDAGDGRFAIEAQRTTRKQCAQYQRAADLQYQFMKFYQVLVAVLAILALGLLAFAALLITRGSGNFQGVLAGLVGLVTGGGALFLLRQRKDARERYDAVVKNLGRCG